MCHSARGDAFWKVLCFSPEKDPPIFTNFGELKQEHRGFFLGEESVRRDPDSQTLESGCQV